MYIWRSVDVPIDLQEMGLRVRMPEDLYLSYFLSRNDQLLRGKIMEHSHYLNEWELKSYTLLLFALHQREQTDFYKRSNSLAGRA